MLTQHPDFASRPKMIELNVQRNPVEKTFSFAELEVTCKIAKVLCNWVPPRSCADSTDRTRLSSSTTCNASSPQDRWMYILFSADRRTVRCFLATDLESVSNLILHKNCCVPWLASRIAHWSLMSSTAAVDYCSDAAKQQSCSLRQSCRSCFG